jgi:hypothetical protein
MLFNADIVCSIETVGAVEAALRGEKRLGLSVGVRTILDPAKPPPIGVGAPELSRWIWKRKHPIIQQLVWGEGSSDVTTMLFFPHPGGDVSMHCFHLAPMFMVKDERGVQFSSTIDDNLIECYEEREIVHFCAGEFALAELSPLAKRHETSKPLSVDKVLERIGPCGIRGSHLRSFRTRYAIVGKPAANHPAADAIIARLP